MVVQVGVLLRAWRWQLIANKDEVCATFSDACVVTYVGGALNLLLPASMGDVARAYYGYRRTGQKEVMLSSSLMDKGLALLAALLMGLVPAAVRSLWHWFWVEVAFAIALTVVLFFPRVLPWNVLTRALHRFRITLQPQGLMTACALSHRLKAVVLALSVLSWLTNYAQLDLAFRALGEPIPFGYLLVAAPLVTVTKLMPFTLDGLGTQDVAMVYLFQPVGVSAGAAVLTSFAARIAGSYVPALIGGFILFAWMSSRGTRSQTLSQTLER
jgi:hypothetical protein